MRSLLRSFLVLATLGVAPVVVAQPAPSVGTMPTTPRLSPRSELTQTVGLTEMRVTWSAPGVRGRTVWGELVPWGQVWRAGADGATKLTVAHDFQFGTTEVPAGTYSLFIVPTAERFTFVLNRDSSGRGAYAWNESEDVARFDATPAQTPARERLAYTFDNTEDGSTHLTIDWAGWKASVPLTVDTPTLTRAGIDANLANLWRPPFNAARYYLDSGQDLAQATAWMEQSIAIQENWWNHWFMARIQAERGNHADARRHATRAMELGGDDPTWNNFFKADAERALAEWPR